MWPMVIENFNFAWKMKKQKNKKHQKLKNSIVHLLMFFKMQKNSYFSRLKIINGENTFFRKSSVQWKLINFYVLNCQFWSDCRQIYTGSKHWYNFLKFIVSKTKNIEKTSKNIKKHQKTSKIHFFNIFLSSWFFWENVAKRDPFWLNLYQKCTILLF